jgi:hypothetical protein
MTKDGEVLTFLESYGRALSSGEPKEISSAWEVPALVLSDQGAIHVESPRQVEEFFGSARQGYRARGIVATKPEVMKVDWLTEAMVQVRARWLQLTPDDKVQGDELSLYVLRRDKDRMLRIRVAIMLNG